MTTVKLQEVQGELEEVVTGAGQVLLDYFDRPDLRVSRKSDKSPITEADIASQTYILRELTNRFPDIPVASEEFEPSRNKNAMIGSFFIIDPLDSTKNFASGIPIFDVSIALVTEGRSQVGAISDPIHHTIYSAVRDLGAFRNKERISVRECPSLKEADFDVNVVNFSKEQYYRVMEDIVPHAKKVRYFGSAVLETCWISTGVLDGMLNHNMSAWDIAAVSLILEEAGGVWGDLKGNPYRCDSLEKRPFLATGDRRLFNEIISLLS